MKTIEMGGYEPGLPPGMESSNAGTGLGSEVRASIRLFIALVATERYCVSYLFLRRLLGTALPW
jgi:hypothetical protein